MATITTVPEQRSTASAAKKVGGYSELVRLSNERQTGANRTVTRDQAGQWVVRDTKAGQRSR